MKISECTVHVKIDAQLFRDFALFDAFRVKKLWKLPLAFALLMLLFALLCFSRYQTADQAVFMGSILLIIGLGLPCFYFANFLASVGKQIQKMGLKTEKPVYTVALSENPDGIHVTAPGGEEASFEWGNVFHVYRGKNCTYLYVHSSRAFLLPDEDVHGGTDALWDLISRQVPDKTV